MRLSLVSGGAVAELSRMRKLMTLSLFPPMWVRCRLWRFLPFFTGLLYLFENMTYVTYAYYAYIYILLYINADLMYVFAYIVN